MTILAGIDYSYTCPSICVFDTKDGELTFEKCKVFYFIEQKSMAKTFGNIHGILIPEWECNEERYNIICDWATSILTKLKVTDVCLEGYAMGSQKGMLFNIAENTSLLKTFMWKNGIKFIIPAPTQIKKFATGKGNAKKDAMGECFIKETGVMLHEIMGKKRIDMKPCNDIVDSYYMLKFGLCEL